MRRCTGLRSRLSYFSITGGGTSRTWSQVTAELRFIEYGGQVGSGMILTFGDEPLTNTASTLCPRCFATTPRHPLLEKGGHRGPGHD